MSAPDGCSTIAPAAEGAPRVKLTDVVQLNPRGHDIVPRDDELVSFVPMRAVAAEVGSLAISETRRWADVRTGYTPFQEHDVIFAKITPCMENGKFAVATGLHDGRAAGSTEFHVLRAGERALPGYVLWYLFTPSVRAGARQNMRGAAGQLRVPPTFFHSLAIPLPSIAVQCAIVAEIEKQFSRLDAGVEALKRAQANLKRYRAAVLKAACEGKLVPTEAELARRERRSYETGAQLLERVLVERRARWQGRGKYKEPAAPDTSNLPELPEGWVWTCLGEAFEVYVGATPSRKRPDFWDGGIPWVSSGEVAFCRISRTRETITSAGLTGSSTELHPRGTVLIGMIGEGRTRGQVAVLDVAATNNQNSAAIRVAGSGLPPEYVYHYLSGQYESNRRIASGNNQPALNKARVQAMPLPLPPQAEQERIVAELERRLSVVEEVEATIATNLRRAGRLRQAVLTKAFGGSAVGDEGHAE